MLWYRAAHCRSMVVVPRGLWLESSSLHRSGGAVQGQSGCWYGSTPGLLYSPLQDGMLFSPKPSRCGVPMAVARAPHLGKPDLSVPATPELSVPCSPTLTPHHTCPHTFLLPLYSVILSSFMQSYRLPSSSP